jgi:Glycosyl hydrolase family 71
MTHFDPPGGKLWKANIYKKLRIIAEADMTLVGQNVAPATLPLAAEADMNMLVSQSISLANLNLTVEALVSLYPPSALPANLPLSAVADMNIIGVELYSKILNVIAEADISMIPASISKAILGIGALADMIMDGAILVRYDSSGTSADTGASTGVSLSEMHTPGASGMLIIAGFIRASAGGANTGPTYGGQPMTLIKTASPNNVAANGTLYLYKAVSISNVPQPIEVDWASGSYGALGSVSFANVDQCEVVESIFGSSNKPAHTLQGAPINGKMFEAIGITGGGTVAFSSSSGQGTQRSLVQPSSNRNGLLLQDSSSNDPVLFSENLSGSTPWCSIGLLLSPPDAAGFLDIGTGLGQTTSPIEFEEDIPAGTNLTVIWGTCHTATATPTFAANIDGQDAELVTTALAQHPSSRWLWLVCFILKKPPIGDAKTIHFESSSSIVNFIDVVHYKHISDIGTPIVVANGSGQPNMSVPDSDVNYLYAQGLTFYGAAGTTFTGYNKNTRLIRPCVSGINYSLLIGDSRGNGGILPFQATRSNTTYGWSGIILPLEWIPPIAEITASPESPAGTDITTVGPTINAAPVPGTPGNGNLLAITAGGQISLNGVVPSAFSATSNVVELFYIDHTAWQKNSAGNWYGPIIASSSGTARTSPLPVISLSNSSLAANSPLGTVVGALSVKTGRASGDSEIGAYDWTFALSGTDAAKFAIDGNSIKTALANLASGNYSITVTASNPNVIGGPYTLPITVAVAQDQQQGGASPGLFFALPNVSASTKKVLGHYFGPFGISADSNGASGQSDYWATQYIPPTGESGSHLSFGGYMRNRPMPRALPPGDWSLADAATDIVNARAVGIDGFFCDIMALSGSYLQRYTDVIAAAANYPGFVIVPMLDCSPSCFKGLSATTTAGVIQGYQGKPSTWVDTDGKMIVGSYWAEQNTAAWWASVATACANLGFQVKFAHVYLSPGSWNQNSASSQWAAGQWGPGADGNISNQAVSPAASSVRAAGQKVLAPVWVQDLRPNQSSYSEASNTKALTNFWDQAIIANADVVQLCTWSDYSEGSVFADSVDMGMVPSDISAYYIAKLKTGSAPTILLDAIYLSYRNHVSGATILGPQTTFMNKRTWAGQEAPTTFNVEALVFLTAPATVTITVAGTPHTFSGVAGINRFTTPAAAGNVSATVTRNSVVTASVSPPVPIRSTLWADDWTYFMFSSIRGTAGRFDPQMTSAGAIPTYP